MKRPTLTALALAVAIALPVATAIAGNGNGKVSVKSLTAKQCTAQKRTDSGAFRAAFGDQSGEHAMRDCMRESRAEVNGEFQNAAQACAAERGETDESIAAFLDTYGSNQEDLPPNSQAAGHSQGAMRNAFGKCVSSKVGPQIEEDVDAFQSAAQQCRAARSADPVGFLATWGNVSEVESNAPDGENSNGAERRAFGKCVSSTAQQVEQEEVVEEPTSEEEPAPAV